jgi:hypothetical protein
MIDNYNPIITRTGSSYEVTATRNGRNLRAVFSRMKSERGALKAELGIFMDGEPIYRSRPSLDSTSSMDAYTRKVLRKRPLSDYGVEFSDFIDDAVNCCIDTYREGAPEILISDRWADPVADDVFLIEPYLLKDQHNTIYGDPSSAKSLMALWWATLLDTGYVESGNDIATSRANCLYLDWETNDVEITRRLRWLYAGIGEESPSNLVYRNCYQPLAAETDLIRDIIFRQWGDEAERPLLIVVDSLGMATEGGLSDETVVAPFFAALRALAQDVAGCTTLTISHTNRDGLLFGSQYIKAESRNIWELQVAPIETGAIHVTAFHRKSNSVGRARERAYNVEFPRDDHNRTRSINISPQPILETDAAGKISAPHLVEELLKHKGPLTKNDLTNAAIVARDLDRDKATHKNDIHKLKNNIRITLGRKIQDGTVLQEGDLIMLPGQTAQEEWIPL